MSHSSSASQFKSRHESNILPPSTGPDTVSQYGPNNGGPYLKVSTRQSKDSHTTSSSQDQQALSSDMQRPNLKMRQSEQGQIRGMGMHNILNPTEDRPDAQTRRRSRDVMESSGVVLPSLAYVSQGVPGGPVKNVGPSMETVTGPPASGFYQPRPVLSPKPFTTNFSGRLSIPMVTMEAEDGQRTPNASNRSPSDFRRHQGLPPAPISAPPSAMERSSFPFPSASTLTPPLSHRRISADTVHSVKSRSSSPKSLSHGMQNQIAMHPISGSDSRSTYGQHATGNLAVSRTTSIQYDPDGKYAGNVGGSYHMTLDTEQGPIRIPVDMQAASKMADEKRRRNAGASARFRQRRKEKEREASQTISRMEREMRNLAEEREFYREERNFFRDMLARAAGPAQIPHRPSSPRMSRQRTASESDSSAWDCPSAAEQPRNTRRKIGEHKPDLTTQVSPYDFPQHPRPVVTNPHHVVPLMADNRPNGGLQHSSMSSSGPLPPLVAMPARPTNSYATSNDSRWQTGP